jgi:carboxypeptidase T
MNTKCEIGIRKKTGLLRVITKSGADLMMAKLLLQNQIIAVPNICLEPLTRPDPMLSKTVRTCFPIVMILTSQMLNGQTRYSRVKISIPPAGMQTLLKLDLDLDHGDFNKSAGTFTSTLHESDITKLKQAGILYDVIVEDEIALFQQNNNKDEHEPEMLMQKGKLHFENSCVSHLSNISTPVGFIPGTYGGYYRFSEMQARIDSLVNHYPTLVQKTILPQTTAGGRPIIVVKISDNVTVNENEAEVLYTGLHHAREGMSMMNLFFFMQYLVENYAINPDIAAIVDNRELFFIPCVNPDGYVYNETNTPGGGGMWRKNRRNNGSGRFGVDLNRNYNVDWGVSGPNINISTDPASDSYIGPSAFSEPETQAIRQFAQARHLKLVIDHHAYGNYYVTPYGVPASHPFTIADNKFYKYASALMGKYNGYFAGDGMQTVNYYAVGNSRDYYMAGDIGIGNKQKTYGYTVEIGPSALGFWPSSVNILPIAKSMFFANLQMAYMAGAYYEIQDRDKLAVTATTGNFYFSLLRIGISTGPVSVSLIPLQNVQSVGPDFVNGGLTNYGDTVHGKINYTLSGGISAGDKIRFIYQINTGGILLNDTIEKIYQPMSLLNEDIEGSLSAWTFTGSWGASSVAAYQGSKSLSESPASNYAASVNSSATYNQSLDLTGATAAYLSFWVRHRAQNGSDKLQIQISPTGTGLGASYAAVCGRQTIAENTAPALTGIRENWTRETIDLNDYVGLPAVGLRFAFSSNGSNNDEGFYIDDIEVVKSPAIVLDTKTPATGTGKDQKIKAKLNVYPNPVKEQLNLNLSSSGPVNYLITISTVTGVRLRTVRTLVNGRNDTSIDMSDLKNQLYIITVSCQETGERSVFKILKQ